MKITKELIHQMVLNHQAVAKPQLDEIFEAQRDSLSEVKMEQEVMDTLVYPTIQVLGNDKMYFFFKDDKMMYQGMVDKEGLYETIKNDILSTPTFLNVHMFIHESNEEALYTLFSNPASLIQYAKEVEWAIQKGQENNHY